MVRLFEEYRMQPPCALVRGMRARWRVHFVVCLGRYTVSVTGNCRTRTRTGTAGTCGCLLRGTPGPRLDGPRGLLRWFGEICAGWTSHDRVTDELSRAAPASAQTSE